MTTECSPHPGRQVRTSEAARAMARARWNGDSAGMSRHLRLVVSRVRVLTTGQRRQLQEALDSVETSA